MSTRQVRLGDQTQGQIPSDQLADGTDTAGNVPVANGDGTQTWGTGTAGAPADATYLTTTAQAGLSAEIVVGATPGGELGGTWASPTVDATHSGSAHHVEDHDHDGSPTQQLLGANTHQTPDTDAATSSLHHTIGASATQSAAGNHTHTAGDSAKASGSGDVTTTSSLADVTGATLSLAAGTYIVIGHFDVLVNNALNDRTFEGHLDVGTVDENDYVQLNAPGLVNVRATLSQAWRITLGSTTTVKLRTQHSGGTVGDFTVKSTNTTIAAWVAGGAGATGPTIDFSAGSTSSSVSFADTDMAIAVAASTNYRILCMIFFNTNATSVGIRLGFNGPASPTQLKVGGYVATGGGGANDSTAGQTSVTAYDTPIVVTTSGPGGTNAVAILSGIFRNGSNAGTLTLRHASETATLTTIEAGSYLELQPF